MGQTFAEKVLSLSCGKALRAGDVCVIEPQFYMSHENASAVARTFERIGINRMAHPERAVIILDHTVPAATEAYAEAQKQVRNFVHKQGISHFYDMQDNGGICHQIMCQEGFAAPGVCIVGSDSHTCTHGAMGAFAVGIGRSEMAAVWATGSIWLQVPHSISIFVSGSFRPGVSVKDFILKVIGDLKADGADYKSVEFHGPGIEAMSVAQRMTICNMGVEMGAKSTVCRPDQKVLDMLKGVNKSGSTYLLWADPDASYATCLEYKLDEIQAGVALPHRVDAYAPVSQVEGTPLHQAFIGSCTNGRLEDLRLAAEVLRGKKVAIRTLVYPASRRVLLDAMGEGIVQALVEAGCTIGHPGCGPCAGVYGGLLAEGEACISTANRNFRGRMGHKESLIYLASPLTVACSALTGVITNPAEVL